jgi:hypothetical protein
MKKAARFLPLILGIVAVALVALFARNPAPPAPPPAPPPPPSVPAPVLRPPAPPPPPVEPTPDVLLERWKTAVRTRDQKVVVDLQAAFLADEKEYRDPLMHGARVDVAPRVRAFCTAVLGRMKAPPAEAFFLEKVLDAHEFPKRSALEALEKLGTKACLVTVDKVAAGDPVEAVRTAAARTAKAVRSR